MVRRRGIARTAARTALIAGTATSVSGRVARRQQQQHERSAASAALSQPAAAGDDLVSKLQQLANLKADGALSDKEYAAAKAKVLAM